MAFRPSFLPYRIPTREERVQKCCGGKDGRARWQKSISRNKLRYCPKKVRSCPQEEYRSMRTGVIGLRLPSPILRQSWEFPLVRRCGYVSFVILRLDAYDDDLVTFSPQEGCPHVSVFACPPSLCVLLRLARGDVSSPYPCIPQLMKDV